MCIENAMQISLKGDTFQSLKEDFDIILDRTLGNMHMKGAEDAVITLKLSVSLIKENAMVEGGCTSITRPSFKHDISSVMQVKDKKTGALTGDYQLVWDEEEGKFVMKKIENGQVNIFDDNEDKDAINADFQETSDPLMLEGGSFGETVEDQILADEVINDDLEESEEQNYAYEEPEETINS